MFQKLKILCIFFKKLKFKIFMKYKKGLQNKNVIYFKIYSGLVKKMFQNFRKILKN